MAVTYGFYDSLNHDRLYNAQQMSAIFDGIINDGVFMSVGNQFHTVAGTGMQVIVKSGRAWFDSTWTLNDAEYPLSIDAADVLLTRIDAVVLEVNSEVATRANTIKVVKGTPASTPAKPTLTNTDTIHQHALAYVTVAKNTTAITNSMIEIVVGKTETPYVTAILQTTDITDLFNQWEDYFQTWFDTVRGTLDGDVALNLQNQITSLRRDTLKSTTPPKIGLSNTAIPDDMFNVLCNVGDIHVWHKTQITSSPIAATYRLEDYNVDRTDCGGNYIPNALIFLGYGTGYIIVGNSISVSNAGVVSLVDTTTYSPKNGNVPDNIANIILGKYIRLSFTNNGPVNLDKDSYYFVPTSSTTGYNDNWLTSTKLQKVVGIPGIPAGTTVTYPVSTNPNAYQEGSDAKPAGYTLGDVVTGQFKMSERYPDDGYYYKYASSISVADNGTISLDNPSQIFFDRYNGGQSYANSCLAKIAGKFIYLANRDSGTNAPDSKPPFNSVPSGVVYIPSDATLTWTEGGALDGFILSKYQPVTGYAAIPAGTTIEYLGKLGDKARVQVVSYVGTGTYGSSNPNSVTANFPIKLLAVLAKTLKNSNGNFSTRIDYNNQYKEDPFMVGALLTTNYTIGSGCGYKEDIYNTAYGKKSEDGKTFSWYTTGSNSARQFNESGYTYIVLLIG